MPSASFAARGKECVRLLCSVAPVDVFETISKAAGILGADVERQETVFAGAKLFDRKTDADAWLVKVRHDVSRGLHVAESQSITVAEAGKLWIERAVREGLERSTTSQYTVHLKHHILPELGSVKLSALTAPRVHAFADKMIAWQ